MWISNTWLARKVKHTIQAIGAAGVDWYDRHARATELARCDHAQLELMALDLGLSTNELIYLSRAKPGSADLLYRRMRALGLDPGVVQFEAWRVMQDMQRCCTQCEDKKRCEHDLNQGSRHSDWRRYCPNAQTLAALKG